MSWYGHIWRETSAAITFGARAQRPRSTQETASAAEWLAYTLQAFGKAKVVGERSAGGANHNEFFELDPQLRLSVSLASPVSAATGSNWEGKGVVPDVPSASAQALEAALRLARP